MPTAIVTSDESARNVHPKIVNATRTTFLCFGNSKAERLTTLVAICKVPATVPAILMVCFFLSGLILAHKTIFRENQSKSVHKYWLSQ